MFSYVRLEICQIFFLKHFSTYYDFLTVLEEKKTASVGIQCDLLLPCKRHHDSNPAKRPRSNDTTPDLSPKTLENFGAKRQSFYSSDDTLDSESEGQNVVKFKGPIQARRRLRYKTQNPENYCSDDDDSKYRSGQLQAEWTPAVSASQLRIELASSASENSPEIF